jgi:hypothetical protein
MPREFRFDADQSHSDGFISYPNVPYTVPYGVMVPGSNIRNLLAPVPCSASHLGFSTLRMEPCWMALGHAAGIAAALALRHKVDVEKVEIAELQETLLDQGAVLIYQANGPKPVSVHGGADKSVASAYKRSQLAALGHRDSSLQ